MPNVTSKPMSNKDYSQVLRNAYNDDTATISTAGFLDGKVGHRITTKVLSSTLDENLFFDEVLNINGVLTNGQPTITGLSSTVGLAVGQYVMLNVGTSGIPIDAKILSINSNTQITMDMNATASGTFSIHFANLLKRIRLSYNNASHDILLDASRVE